MRKRIRNGKTGVGILKAIDEPAKQAYDDGHMSQEVDDSLRTAPGLDTKIWSAKRPILGLMEYPQAKRG